MTPAVAERSPSENEIRDIWKKDLGVNDSPRKEKDPRRGLISGEKNLKKLKLLIWSG